jgi:hypothetical protein
VTAPHRSPEDTPRGHIANGLQLLVFVRAELDSLEVRLHEALRLLEGGAGASITPPPEEESV